MLQKRFVDTNNHSVLWYLVMVILMFMYVYQFRIPIPILPPQMHSVRVASILIFFTAVFRIAQDNKHGKKMMGMAASEFKKFVIIHCFLLFYVAILALAYGPWVGIHMVTVIINLFLFTFIPIVAFYKVIDTLYSFMVIVLWVTIIQTISIWISTVFPQVGLVIDATFNSDFLDVDMTQMRLSYSGGIGCITSSGVVRYSLGFVACIYLFFTKSSQWYVILLLIFGLTCSMIARTGILVSLIAFLVFLFCLVKTKKIANLKSIVIPSVLVLLVYHVVINSNIYLSFFDDRFVRTTKLVEEQKYASSIMDISFFQGYFEGENRKVPDISWETVIGTGVISGKSGNGIEVNVDGGYLRLYVGYGLILSVLFYLYLVFTLYKLSKNACPLPVKYALYLLLVIIFVSELKEWSIYSSCHLMVFFLMSLLAENDLANYRTLLLKNAS